MPAAGFASWRSHFGLAIETTYGATQATPQVWIPAKSIDQYDDDQGLIFDENIRASASKLQAVYVGMQKGGYSATFDYYPEQCARFWPLITGADTIGSSSNAYWQHTFTTSTGKPYSATLFDFIGDTGPERQFVGAQMTSFNWKFDRASGLITCKPTWVSAAPSTGISETSASYSSVIPLKGWQPVFSIASSTKVTLLTWDMTISRDVALVFAGNNSQRPNDAEVGQIDVTGKISFYGSTDGPYTNYRANTQQALDLVIPEGSVSGSTWSRLEVLMTKAVFTKVTPDRSGPYIRYDADFRAIYNATDAGPMQVITTVTSSSQFST